MGFGSDLAILGANPRREWCPEHPQTFVVGSRGGPLGMGGAPWSVLSIAVSANSFD